MKGNAYRSSAKLYLLLVSMMAAQTVLAGSEGDFSLGFNIGQSYLEPDTAGTIYSISDRTDAGFKLYLNYSLGDRLELEAYYSDLGKVKLAPSGDIAYQDLGITAMYYLLQAEQEEKLSAFLRLGMGTMSNQTGLNYTRDNDTHLMLGAGIEYALQDKLSLRVDLDMYDYDAQLVSVGLRYYFSAPAEVRPVAVEPTPVQPAVADPVAIEQSAMEQPTVQDTDGDGIVDNMDECPATPAGKRVDENGCELAGMFILHGLNFAPDSADILSESATVLNKLLGLLQRYPEVSIELSGHTDSQGSKAHNLQLSEKRALAVRDFLVEKGIEASRLSATGYGEAQPIDDNATATGRASNRRVEVHLQ